MRLRVKVIEARDIPAMDLNGSSDPYVRLQLGKQRSRTKVVKKSLNPTWDEEFIFKVDDLNEELVVNVLDEDKYFNDDFVGYVTIPIARVFDARDKGFGNVWYALQPKNKKSKNKDCGEIHLGISFSHSGSLNRRNDIGSRSRRAVNMSVDSASKSLDDVPLLSAQSPGRGDEVGSVKEDKPCAQKSLKGRIAQIFNKSSDTATSKGVVDTVDVSESVKSGVLDETDEDLSSSSDSFEEVMKIMEGKDQESEIPSNLSGGVLVDQMYVTSSQDLNCLLFSPDSSFYKSWVDEQGITDMQVKPWRFENDGLKRVLTYVKPATRLVKATRAIEDQTYLKADEKAFAVLSSVSTPDIIYGSTFKVELLFCITPGPELSSGEQSSHLVISWRMNFIQSTMMKSMIENGARNGLKDSFDEFANFLSQTVKPVDSKDMGLNKEQILASLKAEPQSDWKLAVQYFVNLTVVSCIFMAFYLLIHMWLAAPSTIQGLEFVGLDLPDSIGEFIVCGLMVLQGQRVLGFISRFIQARKQKGSDHGIKAQGEGWLLTVALINGSNLPAVDSSGFCDPYVVFTCNGKTRTSSIKFQQSNPQWNEIFEFDATDEPPSVLDVEIYDFDGPFDEATSLGHAEINFVKSNISDLADVWVPLQGKLAMTCQSKLHLRIFLNNTKGSSMVRNYLSKMEKEVGKKINLRSPQTNKAFQKLFGLPPEEFLINDFTCHLKRKMPRQGRLFLSARIIGFHANLFGHKTKFFFLWEDVEDIQILPPCLSSMGSPILVITLRKGRGMDARHGAKAQDEEGRLKFHFQSFVSFNVANRTIMALWKARSLTPEQKVKLVEQEAEEKSLQSDESGALLDLDDVPMTEVYSSVVPVSTQFFMELFAGGELDHAVMERTGCIDYSCSPWDSEKPDVFERQIYYRFDKSISRYRGEVTSTQQKTPLSNGNGWLLEEVMTLHGVPLGDYFNLHLRYQIEEMPTIQGCNVHVFTGIAWLKSTKHAKRMTKNVNENLEERLKIMFSVVEKEYARR